MQTMYGMYNVGWTGGNSHIMLEALVSTAWLEPDLRRLGLDLWLYALILVHSQLSLYVVFEILLQSIGPPLLEIALLA